MVDGASGIDHDDDEQGGRGRQRWPTVEARKRMWLCFLAVPTVPMVVRRAYGGRASRGVVRGHVQGGSKKRGGGRHARAESKRGLGQGTRFDSLAGMVRTVSTVRGSQGIGHLNDVATPWAALHPLAPRSTHNSSPPPKHHSHSQSSRLVVTWPQFARSSVAAPPSLTAAPGCTDAPLVGMYVSAACACVDARFSIHRSFKVAPSDR